MEQLDHQDPYEQDLHPDGKSNGNSTVEIFTAFLKLGLTSFGGPIAHIGYFRDELVLRRKWVSEKSFADLLALCQFLPGPASSQLGFLLGLMRGGSLLGGIAAFLGLRARDFRFLKRPISLGRKPDKK